MKTIFYITVTILLLLTINTIQEKKGASLARITTDVLNQKKVSSSAQSLFYF